MGRGLRIEKMLKGWRKSYRARHLTETNKNLSDSEFRLLELYRDIADWDEKHIETFNTFYATDSLLAPVLGCDASSISRRRNSLLSKGLIAKNSDGR